MQIPKDPVRRYLEIYAALYRGRKWWWDPTMLQYATMTVVTDPGNPEQLADSILNTAEDIKTQSGWLGELNSDIRFIVAGMAVNNRDYAHELLAEIKRVKSIFRSQKLRNGQLFETIAILIMRYSTGGKDGFRKIEVADIDRFKTIHSEMAKHHWWLTSVDDYPACAFLLDQSESPENICSSVEDIYQYLNGAGFWKGNPLQSAANLLYLSKEHPSSIANRFHELAVTFRANKVRIWQSEYDELAILSFLPISADSIVADVIEIREELRCHKPKPGWCVAFNLACSLCFLKNCSANFHQFANAKAMVDMNSVIAAQQAAIIACAVAATAATSSAAASSG